MLNHWWSLERGQGTWWLKKKDVEDEDNSNHYRVDILWWHISKFAIPVTLVKHFKLLPKLADLVLVMPHSNVDLEKLFSIVQKKETVWMFNNEIWRDNV